MLGRIVIEDENAIRETAMRDCNLLTSLGRSLSTVPIRVSRYEGILICLLNNATTDGRLFEFRNAFHSFQFSRRREREIR